MRTESDNWLCLALLCALLVAWPWQARAEEHTSHPESHLRFFNIPAQPLENALLAYAEQAGIQILFRPELLQGRRSPGIKGVYDPQAAIVALLRGTGFNFQLVGDRTVVVAPEQPREAVGTQPNSKQ